MSVGISDLNIFRLGASTYKPHPLHSGSRDWLESNCYIDVYIEMLHALEMEVYACLSFCISSTFEGDQWTFFKPPLAELRSLYGLEINELTLWRPLLDHVVEQSSRQCIVIPELDSGKFSAPHRRT
ncbi:MAG: DUF1839 family protein [Nannocystaceae bacterium]